MAGGADRWSGNAGWRPPGPAPAPAPAVRRPLALVVALVAALVAVAVVAAGLLLWAGPATPVAAARQLVPRMTIRQVLDAQTRALLSGDEAGWLADVDRGRPDLVGAFRDRFASLRALQVSAYEQELSATGLSNQRLPAAVSGSSVLISYCLGGVACDLAGSSHPEVRQAMSFATHNGRLWITELGEPGGVPSPWQFEPLTVRAGARTVVAAPAALADRLAGVAEAAERAAPVVDRFARHVRPPAHYVLFLAGEREMELWYGGELRGGQPLGVALPLGNDQVEIVIAVERIKPYLLPFVIQHEMGHAVTANNTDAGASDVDTRWLKEGVAEYIAWAGHDVKEYDAGPSLRHILESGRWDGRLPLRVSRGDETNAAYVIGYLAIHHFADRYGEERLLDFLDEAVRHHKPQTETAARIFGRPWPDIERDAVAFIRAAAK